MVELRCRWRDSYEQLWDAIRRIWKQDNTGSITNNYGIYLGAPCTGSVCMGMASSSIGNSYGLYLENMDGSVTGVTNAYAIYSAGGKSYFGGSVGIGTTSPTGMLSINSTTTGTGYGVYALSATTTNGYGTYSLLNGIGNTGYAGYFTNTSTGVANYGLYASTSSGTGYAGYFQGAVNVNGVLTVSSCVGCGGAAAASLSSLTSATTTNSLDSANWAQTWKWGTLSTQTALTLTSSSVTTGTVLNATAGNAAGTGYAGYFSQSGTGAAYGVYATEGGATNTGYAGYFSNTSTAGYALYVNGTAGTAPITGLAAPGTPTIAVANGGTGLTSGTSGGIPYYSSTSTMASSALLTQYGVIYGGGAGGSPVATAVGTTGQVLMGNTGAAPTWGTSSVALSSITSATTTSSIDSTNWAQTWKWGTLSTQTALTLTTSSMTSGTLSNT